MWDRNLVLTPQILDPLVRRPGEIGCKDTREEMRVFDPILQPCLVVSQSHRIDGGLPGGRQSNIVLVLVISPSSSMDVLGTLVDDDVVEECLARFRDSEKKSLIDDNLCFSTIRSKPWISEPNSPADRK
jgi:hypothetical protein